jgi:hypothetical protein
MHQHSAHSRQQEIGSIGPWNHQSNFLEKSRASTPGSIAATFLQYFGYVYIHIARNTARTKLGTNVLQEFMQD